MNIKDRNTYVGFSCIFFSLIATFISYYFVIIETEKPKATVLFELPRQKQEYWILHNGLCIGTMYTERVDARDLSAVGFADFKVKYSNQIIPVRFSGAISVNSLNQLSAAEIDIFVNRQKVNAQLRSPKPINVKISSEIPGFKDQTYTIPGPIIVKSIGRDMAEIDYSMWSSLINDYSSVIQLQNFSKSINLTFPKALPNDPICSETRTSVLDIEFLIQTMFGPLQKIANDFKFTAKSFE